MAKDLTSLNKALNQEAPPYYVGLVVIDKERQKIMLGKRREDGMWTGPGGGANVGENPKEAAIREAFEEAALQLKARDLKELPSVVVSNGKVCHCFLVYVDSRATKVHVHNDPDKEVDKWSWYSLNEPMPGKMGHFRLMTINNAKMKALGLRKSILSNPDAEIDINTAEQSMDELAARNNEWVTTITSLMHGVDYGEIPRELMLPGHLRLFVSKVDDGIFSAILKKEDPEAGDQGEVQTQLVKMTPEAMVQALKAKGYLPKEEVTEPAVAEIATAPVPRPQSEYKALFNALKKFEGELHIHLAKALDEGLEKGKPFPVGTTRVWAGQKYVKHQDGWVAVFGDNHGKLMGKFKQEATHKDHADGARDVGEKLHDEIGGTVEQILQGMGHTEPHEPEKRPEAKEKPKKKPKVKEEPKEEPKAEEPKSDKKTGAKPVYTPVLKENAGKWEINDPATGSNFSRHLDKESAERTLKTMVSENTVKAEAHLMGSQEFLEKYLKDIHNLTPDRVKPKSRTAIKDLHKRLVKEAEAEGYEIADKVIKEYPELQGLPDVLNDENQKKTNLFKSVDLKKVPKKRQADVIELLKDSNAVLATMGVKLKQALHFAADSSLAEGDRSSTMATYNGAGGKDRSIHLKDVTRASTSIMHEIGHALDYALSGSEKSGTSRADQAKKGEITDAETQALYTELMETVTSSEHYKENAKKGGKHNSYLNHPTEIFARAFEVYSLGKAKELAAEGKISKSFVADYLPDVFRDPNSPERAASIAKMGEIQTKITELVNANDAMYSDALSQSMNAKPEASYMEHRDVAMDQMNKNKEYQDNKAKMEPLIKERDTVNMERLKGKVYTIEPAKQDEYINKISGLMDKILATDKIKKAFDQSKLFGLFKALTELV